MGKSRLSEKEKAALSSWWHLPLRVQGGNVEAKKGDCWGILCSVMDGKKHATIIIEKEEKKENG